MGPRPPITNDRKKIIEAHLKRKRIHVERPFVQAEYTYPREGDDGYCVFYDAKTRRCIIHPVKPETCVAGPVTFDINTLTRTIEWYLKRKEICSLAGMIYEDKKVLREHLETAKKELSRLVHELDSPGLKAILAKEEPETFKIEESALDRSVIEKLANSRDLASGQQKTNA